MLESTHCQGNPGGNFLTTRPATRLKDLAGIDSILQKIEELAFFPTKFPELYSYLGVSPPCGILLNGPSGCGKTMLASAIAGELGLPFYKVSYFVAGAAGTGMKSRVSLQGMLSDFPLFFMRSLP